MVFCKDLLEPAFRAQARRAFYYGSNLETSYHWGTARNFQFVDRGLTFRIRDAQASVSAQDMDILDA